MKNYRQIIDPNSNSNLNRTPIIINTKVKSSGTRSMHFNLMDNFNELRRVYCMVLCLGKRNVRKTKEKEKK